MKPRLFDRIMRNDRLFKLLDPSKANYHNRSFVMEMIKKNYVIQTKYEGASYGLILTDASTDDKVFVKKDFTLNEMVKKESNFVRNSTYPTHPFQLKYMLAYEALYNLGLGAEVGFVKDKSGNILNVSKTLYKTSNLVYEKDNIIKKIFQTEFELTSNVREVMNLEDVLDCSKFSYKEVLRNAALVVKSDDTKNRIKMFDFMIKNNLHKIKPLNSENDLNKFAKINSKGQFMTKAERNDPNHKKGDFETVIKYSFAKTLKRYAKLNDFYISNESVKWLQDGNLKEGLQSIKNENGGMLSGHIKSNIANSFEYMNTCIDREKELFPATQKAENEATKPAQKSLNLPNINENNSKTKNHHLSPFLSMRKKQESKLNNDFTLPKINNKDKKRTELKRLNDKLESGILFY